MRPSIVVVLCLLALCAPVLALETEVLFDGTNCDEWDEARDAARLAREYSLSELKPVTDPAALSWRFASKEVSFNDIFLRRETVRQFERIRVRVKNEGPAVTLAAKVRDFGGGEWSADQHPLAANGDWQWVEFPLENWKVASWSKDDDGTLDFPLEYFTLIAFGVKPGVEYSLKIAQVEAQRADPPVATLHNLQFPKSLEAGESYRFSLSFSLDKACISDDAALVLRRGRLDMARAPLDLKLSQAEPGRRYELRDIPLSVPVYAFGGECSVVLRLSNAHVQLNGENVDQEVQAVTINARQPGKTVADVRSHNGAPTLFINDEPHSGMAYAAYRPGVEVFSDFTAAGVDLYTFSATPTEAGYGLSQTTWTGPGEYDYSQLDERVMMVLEANPDAYIFPRLYVHAPKWWSEQHPDDIVLYDPGDGNYVPFVHSGNKPAPSWASEAWRQDTIEGLRRLIAHVEGSPYADRIIGYHIASGTTEEWMMWGANENQWVDYSPVNIARFRQWLARKYGTVQALKAAWKDDEVSFDTATIKPKREREATAFASLRDPDKEQAVIDFYLYNSDLVAETIRTFAKAVKDITSREKTVGVFYGYLLQLCGEQRQQNAGHLALERVLASPDIDFLCSPTSYAFRQLGGEGTSHFMSLLASVRLHGKLWFDENDIRTSLAPGEIGAWGKPANIDQDIIQQDKELANVLVNGAAQWWFDVGSNRYNEAKLMGRIGELTVNAGQVIELDRAPTDEVAMVVDEKSLCYLRVGDPLGRLLLVGQLPALHRIGAPVGHYLISDVPQIADRKVFLIMTSFAPTEADRQAIDALKRDGHVLVFCYVPGLYRDGQIDEAAMREFTGIDLRISREATALRVTLQTGHAITEDLAGRQYGVDHQTWPVCYAQDALATVLGTLPDGKPGLVVKEFEDWTSIHTAAPMLSTEVVRSIAQYAGVHSYIDTPDVVWAARSMVAVSVKEPGRRTVRLPGAATVRDLYSGDIVAEDVDEFEADFSDRATRVFVWE